MKPPERLLAAFIDKPAGMTVAEIDSCLGAEAPAARAALVERGHVLQEDGAGRLRLVCAGYHFDPAAFAAVQRGQLGAALEVWERTSSTNDLVRSAAEWAAPEGAAWLAEEQTAGRGRQGRVWGCAPHAGLLFSILLRPSFAPGTRPSLLPLVLALGICEGLTQATHQEVRPHWPNDLWLGGRKLGGLLVEARHGGDPYAVVGVGVNVESRAAESIADAVALENVMPHLPRREALLAALLAGMERRFEDWSAGRFEALVAAWERVDVVVGRRLRLATDARIFSGRALGVTGDGLLRLDTGAGRALELAAGEVHLL